MRRMLLALLGASVLMLAVPAGEAGSLSELIVVTASGRHTFFVETADTAGERAGGLMFRQALAANHGMLFDYGKSIETTMWMKNTYISLDIFFVAEDGRIVNITENAVPRSLDTIASRGSVRAALEVNAGTARRIGAVAGDHILHPLFE